MSSQEHEAHSATSQDQRRGRKLRFWLRWIFIIIAVLFISAGTTIGIIQGSISNTLFIIFNALGVMFALFQWLLPISSSTPAHTLMSSSQPQAIITQPQTSPPVKIAYRGIVSSPPPIDSRTIQQREKVVREVYTKLTQLDTTAVALTGIGGVGKSTLAALIYRFAEEERLAGKSLFASEGLWLRIDPVVTMVDLAGNLFEALGKPMLDFSRLAPQNQAITLFNMLNTIDGARLIILDQFENLLDWQTGQALIDRPGIGEWLDVLNSQKCRCRILLTSCPAPQGTRKYPSTYMQEYRVGGLEVPEGIELLRMQGIQASEEDLRTAVQRCDGHVFALILLASLLRNHNLSLAVLFKEHVYAEIWEGDVARNFLDRIYTQQLDKVQRRLLIAFSVYRQPVSLDAVHFLMDTDVDLEKKQLLLGLNVLIAQHLLQASGEGRYQLHTIVANYARGHFVEGSEQVNQHALRMAHARATQYYLQQADLSCPPRGQRRQSSDVQLFIEAIWHLCQAGQWSRAYSLMEQEEIFADLKRWGENATLLELHQLLLPLEKWSPERSQAARIYSNLGRVYRTLGQMERAREYLEWALTISREVGDHKGEGAALSFLGRIYADLGQNERAREYLERALSVRRKIGDRDGEGWTLDNLGRVYADLGKVEQAREYCEQALNIHREMGNRTGEGTTLNYLGRIHVALGKREQAQEYYEKALVISREVRNRGGEGTTLNNLGRVYADLGQEELAREYYGQALDIWREIGDRAGESAVLNNLGLFFTNRGETERGREYYEQALSIRREIGDRAGESTVLNNLGRLCALLGEVDQAKEYYARALSLNKERGDSKEEAITLQYIGMLHFEQEKYDVALSYFLVVEGILEKKNLNSDEIKRWVEVLRRKVSAEEFIKLLERVESQAAQVVTKDLEGISNF